MLRPCDLANRLYEARPELNSNLRVLFIILQIFGGQVGLPVFVGTMILAPSVKRHWTLINFLVSWIMYSMVFCLTYVPGGFPFFQARINI